MNQNRDLLTKIKSELDREKIATILCFIGQEITKDFHFKDNQSFSISRDGYIKDFGSTGFSGDIIDFLQYRDNLSFNQAVKYVAECLGINYE